MKTLFPVCPTRFLLLETGFFKKRYPAGQKYHPGWVGANEAEGMCIGHHKHNFRLIRPYTSKLLAWRVKSIAWVGANEAKRMCIGHNKHNFRLIRPDNINRVWLPGLWGLPAP
jgi:hypothetical protein